MDYKTTIGIEVHAELTTRTKMFCNSKNDPDETKPNVNVCPVCMGHPGTLPVINRAAVRHVLKIGTAVGGELADFTEFDRKNYFYPDLPKGFQISQYKYPLVLGGVLNGVALERVHLEEDTARSSHERGKEGETYSLVDFNRSGLPLMELVTKPVVHSAEEASAFARELQILLRYLGASDANMEKGQMRVEANISIAPKDSEKLGTKVEVKNLNSFKVVEKAIAYEVARQANVLDHGEKVVQETRGWDEAKQATFSQRLKEESHDYRYFPEPDLPKLYISEIPDFAAHELKKDMPELPWERRRRYIETYGLRPDTAEFFVRSDMYSDFFNSVAGKLKSRDAFVLAGNYITSDMTNLGAGAEIVGKVTPDAFAALIMLIVNKEISSRGAKDILAILFAEGGDAKAIAEKTGLLQKSDESVLRETVNKIIEENQKVALDYKGGKEVSLQFLIGQGMKATSGSANPEVLKKLFIEQIKQ